MTNGRDFFLSPDHKNLTKKISLCDKLTYKVEKEIILKAVVTVINCATQNFIERQRINSI